MRRESRIGPAGLVWAVLAGSVFAAEAVPEIWSKLLVDGMTTGAKGIAEAKQAHANLKKAPDKESQAKADYALGLVLVKQLKYREAQAAFADARQAQPLFGAWEGEIWCRLAAKDLKGGYPLLEAYAKLVVYEATPVKIEERQAAAKWLGRTMAALAQTLDAPKSKELHETQARLVASILGDEHRPAFEQGGAEVAVGTDDATSKTTATDADVPSATVPATPPQPEENGAGKPVIPAGDGKTDAAAVKPGGSLKTKRENEEAARVEKTQKKSEKARENVKKTAEQWKTWYDDNISKVDITLNQLVQSASGLQARMVAVQNEYQRLKQQEAQLARLNPKPGSTAYAELTNLGSQAGALAGEGQQLSLDLGNVQRQGAAVLQQRAAIVRTYEQATGQLVKQDANLKRIQEKLAEKKGEGAQGGAAAKVAKGAAKRTKTPAFKEVAPFDVEARRDALLVGMGLPVPAASAAP